MRRLFAPIALTLLLTACGGGPSSLNAPAIATQRAKLGIIRAYIPHGRYGRHRVRYMRPRYITIHSTQNYNRNSNARTHAAMLSRGELRGRKNSLGYVTWHYTIDDHSIYQSLPDREAGQHADYEGPGNRYSIGIEMCENRGDSRSRTLDRTARLIALLMHEYNIPLSKVVPHQHWRMIRHSDGRDLGHKNCPYFLMENGKPSRKWSRFLRKVQTSYNRS
ncbi:MAG: N-acetylmuramoyl-L-alanine amidase [Akkermansiaceae bacterium]